jgi:DNA-directed RNA polymerase I subunit RPA1
MAKLRLIERGLLDEAQGLDDMTIRTKRRKADLRGGDGGDDDETGKDETDGKTVSDETPQDFMTRIHIYVAVQLSRNPNKTRDSYKDGMSYQAKKDLTNEFLKATLIKRCQNPDCGR